MAGMGDTEIPILRKAAKDQRCIRCSTKDGTVVGAHYTGARRLSYGGGLSRKVHDLIMAHLCSECHRWMDQLSRDKSNEGKWLHSEEFQHCVLMTLIRLYEQGFIVVTAGVVA